MAYTDTLFILLFLLVFGISRLCRTPWREWFLILASLCVIISWGIFSLALFLGIAILNYIAAALIARQGSQQSRRILFGAIAVNIAVLGAFKYFNFFAGTLGAATGWAIPIFTLGIPLAISFYTFHIISYLMDLQRGRTQKLPFDRYLFYLAFFPHVVAGPIVRTWQLASQFGKTQRRLAHDLTWGLHYFVTGFFLKSVAADNIAQRIDPIWAGTAGFTPSAADHWLTALLYYCQIYADFAGYSLMALGMARLLGYRLPVNFRAPMLAASLREFWRRWHMTLSRWLRDYLYMPLGGNRGSAAQAIAAVMITMVLGGLWHGAAWGFVIWGAMHGIGILCERIFRKHEFYSRFSWPVTQLWVMLAWILFRAPDLTAAGKFFKSMVSVANPEAAHIHADIGLGLLFAAPAFLHHAAPWLIRKVKRKSLAMWLGVLTALMLLLSIVIASPIHSFIYFKF